MSNSVYDLAKFRGLVRRSIVRILQATGLNAIASHYYYSYFHGFKPAGAGLDHGFEAIFQRASEIGSFENGAVYCEFGVFKGYSFWKAQDLADHLGIENVRFFGFDSFEGLPEVEGIDRTAHGEFRPGQYACSLSKVRENLDTAGVDWDRTHLIKGFFEDALTEDMARKHRIERVGVAMIDCDLYSSTVEVLEFLRDRLHHNSILIMDDWNCFNRDENRGQRRALREFLETEPGLSVEPFVGYGANSQAFIVNDKRNVKQAGEQAESLLYKIATSFAGAMLPCQVVAEII